MNINQSINTCKIINQSTPGRLSSFATCKLPILTELKSAHDSSFDSMFEQTVLKSDLETSILWPRNSSAAEYILKKAKENASNGVKEWLTNSVTGHKVKLDELETASRKVASAMYKRGMRKGDVAVYLTTDVTSIYTIIIGVWRVGGIVHSSYPADTHDTLAQRLRESKVRWMFCDSNSVAQCKEASSDVDWPVEIISFGKCENTTDVDDLFLDNGYDCPVEVPATDLDDTLLILCTSGTTGPSKGAMHTNASILASCLNPVSGPKKLTLLLGKSTHDAGLTVPLKYACLGLPIIMMDKISTGNILSCVSKYKPSYAIGFPTHLMQLAKSENSRKYDLSSLEAVCSSGMPVTESFYEAISLLPTVTLVKNCYGLTECGMLAITDEAWVTTTSVRSDVLKMSVGRLCPTRALKVLDVTTGHSLGPMERGEIVVKSPTMAMGYWNRPEETATAFVDGWFKTGDFGYYDNAGFIFIEDRVKDTFKYYNDHRDLGLEEMRNDFEISPTELETIILKHPAVAEVVVFGIKDPCGGDHIARALVVLKAGETSTATEIRQFADSKIALYKQLRGGVYIVDKLPSGSTGKLARYLIAKLPLPI